MRSIARRKSSRIDAFVRRSSVRRKSRHPNVTLASFRYCATDQKYVSRPHATNRNAAVLDVKPLCEICPASG